MGQTSTGEREPLEPDAGGLCYADEPHFDETMTRVARDHLARRARTVERWIPIGLLAAVAGSAAMCAGAGAWAGYCVLVAAAVVLVHWVQREVRQVRRIEREQLCFRCTYALFQQTLDEQGWGACPECGGRFHAGYYRRPPAGYRRGRPPEAPEATDP